MRIVELISDLQSKDIKLFLDNGKLKVNAPEGALTEEIILLLKDNKPEIIEFLNSVILNSKHPIVRVERHKRMPLSFAQQRLWFLNQLSNDSRYNMAGSFDIAGELNTSVLKKTFELIVGRHEILRTCFVEYHAGPCQIIHEPEKWEMPEIDLTHLDEQQIKNQKKILSQDHASQLFNLGEGPLLRTTVLRTGEREYTLLIAMHHIISDEWSVGILIQDMVSIYDALSRNKPNPMEPLAFQYVDFSKWQKDTFESDDIQKTQLSYWRQQLKDITVLEVPTDFPRQADQSSEGENFTFEITEHLKEKLNVISKDFGVTVFSILLSSYKILLHRYSGMNDICVGIPFSNRDQQELEPIIGFFVNSLPIRSEINEEQEFIELVKGVQSTLLDADENQAVPFEQIVAEVSEIRDLSHSPIFQTMFSLEVEPTIKNLKLGDLSLKFNSTEINTAKFDFSLHVENLESGMAGNWEYNTNLFESDTAESMAKHFLVVLEQVIENPNQIIKSIELMNEEEKNLVLKKYNKTYKEIPDLSVVQLFIEQAEHLPGKVAIVQEGKSINYGELHITSNQLASLLSKNDIGRGSRVVVYMDRSLEAITALLAVLKVGASYVPIDSAYPENRVDFILEDVQAKFIITQKKLKNKINSNSTPVFYFDEDKRILKKQNFKTPKQVNREDDEAYIIYTSGSTGQPKGVKIPHLGLNNLIEWHKQYYKVDLNARATQMAGFSFDACVWEIWPYLTSGSSLFIADDEIKTNAKETVRWIAKNQISHCFMPTPLVEAVLAEPLPKNWALKYLLTGGDRLTSRAHEGNRFKLFNNYGPTECSVVTTATEVDSQTTRKLPSLGTPISNFQCYVLDKALKLLPEGMVGELYVGGEGLALGYVNRPDLTESVFIKNPFGSGRLYKTGDLVRRLPNGELDYWGRIDQQVQIRGFRVEVGEIEAFLNNLNEINESVVIVQEEGQNKILVAYIIHNDHLIKKEDIDTEKIRKEAKENLPEYMVPAFYVLLDKFPITANGKVDRSKLPKVNIQKLISNDYVAPETRTEKIIASVWRNLLKVKKVGVHDKFFDLGGHSLIATQIIARIRESFKIDLPLKLLFEGYDIHELAKKVDDAILTKNNNVLPSIKPLKRDKLSPVSFAQQRMWVLDKLETGDANFNAGSAYNISAGLLLQGGLNIDALNGAFEKLLARHEILRTTFISSNGELFQQVLEPSNWIIVFEDFSEMPLEEKNKKVKIIADREAIRSFDLEAGKNARRTRLIRTVLIKIEEDKHYLFTTMHHIISDGWSMNILIKEIEHLYNAELKNEKNDLLPLEVQYADYSIWQRKVLQGEFYNKQLFYWKENLKGLQKTEFPVDKQRPALQSFKGSDCVFKLSPNLSSDVEELAKSQGHTPFMVLLAAYKLLICRYTGQEDICVGTPIANRTQAQQEDMIGFFINTLALRTDFSGNPEFEEILQRIHETTIGAYSHQDIPFEKLVDELNVERDLSRTPLFQTFFSLNHSNLSNLNLDGIEVSFYDNQQSTAQFDLALNIEHGSEGFSGRLIYNTDLFELKTIEYIAKHYINILEDAVQNIKTKVSDIKMIGNGEIEKINFSNNTEKKYPSHKNIIEIFEDQVKKSPDNIALKFEEQSLSYSELNKKSNQLASYLIELGLEPGQIVGLCLERSIELIVSIYGIIKAGGAYTPLDPDYPQQRLNFILDDAKAAFIITENDFKERFDKKSYQVICTNEFDLLLHNKNHENISAKRSKDDPCYVIYTSGSTGQPKGVIIPHAGIINRLQWMQEQYPIGGEDKLLQKTPYSFDVSVWEFFWPLMTGASLVIIEPGGHKDPVYIKNIIDKENITTVHFVPSMLSIFLNQIEPRQCSSIKRVFCSGEALSKQLENDFFEYFNAELHNLYGPTEASIDVSYWQCQKNDTENKNVPIGFPISNHQLYILDKYLNLLPVGIPGELHIAGPGLAQGYLGSPELSASKFISNPFSNKKSSKLYKTGDLAKYLPNGAIEYLGRIDNQVKLRGFRIELGEIESKIIEQFPIKNCAVIVREDSPGDQRLVAYVVPEISMPPADIFQKELGKLLPEFMVPSNYIHLDNIPVTSNGKLDRKALPKIENKNSSDEFISPRNETENELADIWCDILNLDVVGVKDNFFELGGHSLLATQIISRIRDHFKVEIPLSSIFESPTIENVAIYILENELLSTEDAMLAKLLDEFDDQDNDGSQSIE